MTFTIPGSDPLVYVRHIARMAILASEPVGMGRLHYQPNDKIDLSDAILSSCWNQNVQTLGIDYFGGRMVKLYIQKLSGDLWEINRGEERPNPEYQSWASRYPTFTDLIEAAFAGVEHKDEPKGIA